MSKSDTFTYLAQWISEGMEKAHEEMRKADPKALKNPLRGLGKGGYKLFPNVEAMLCDLFERRLCMSKEKPLLMSEDLQTLYAYNGERFEQITIRTDTFIAELLELVKEPTDEIKVGDRVEVIYQSGNRRGMVCEVKYDGAVDVDFGGGCIGHDILQGRIKKVEPTDKHNTITIPVKADFGEDVGFALLDRALELQKKYTELEGEVKRLYEFVFNLSHGATMLQPIQFDNECLGYVANAVRFDFRPHTKEETETQLTALRAVLGKEG